MTTGGGGQGRDGRAFPTWLKVSIPLLVFVGLIVAAAIKVLLDELPDHAQAPAIQARFAEQINFLSGLAADLPFECDEDRLPDLDPAERLERSIREVDAWQERIEEGQALFSDAAILGAHVILHCGEGTISSRVKGEDDLDQAWSRSMLASPEQWPSATLWYVGRQRVVRYEDQVPGPSGDVRELRLVLDLERLRDD